MRQAMRLNETYTSEKADPHCRSVGPNEFEMRETICAYPSILFNPYRPITADG
jgi:hypothetical protein